MLRSILLAAALLIGTTGAATSAVTIDESAQGDISNDPGDPTARTLISGTNSVIGTMGPGDLEYFRFVVPSGMRLDGITLSDFAGDSFVSFLAVQRGSTFTVAPSTGSAAGLLGWTHFSNVGQDLLPAMGTSGFGAEGFTPPLPAGTYTFWMQEIDADVQYRLDFDVTAVPEPSLWLMLACGLVAVTLFQRRRA